MSGYWLASDNTDVTRPGHQAAPGTAPRRKLSINVSEPQHPAEYDWWRPGRLRAACSGPWINIRQAQHRDGEMERRRDGGRELNAPISAPLYPEGGFCGTTWASALCEAVTSQINLTTPPLLDGNAPGRCSDTVSPPNHRNILHQR
ncbi:unnamed protein product [Pleuronectes platessa]|uniref:Uncharacterized protein n=1 Tax=Pleuronectes platessa TaxID=8262 RepID=A0A9N7TS14_PLEPL|nr:unnamed protein product [Pleuronectes platessa]